LFQTAFHSRISCRVLRDRNAIGYTRYNQSMYFVYILMSERDNGWYIGSTVDIIERLKNHNYGRVKSTKNRRPLKLIYSEQFPNKILALKAEEYYKSGAGRTKLKKMIKY